MRIALSALILLTAGSASAQTNGPPSGWSSFIRGGSVYNFETGLEGGGDVAVHRFYAEGGMAYLFRRDRMVSLSAGYGQDDYRFNGLPDEPWNNINNIRTGLFSRWGFDNDWSSFFAASVRAYGEPGVDPADALTGALFGGASFRFSDRLALGPGLGVAGQLEDRPSVFPILVIDWDLTEKLNLSTGGGLAATAGPGLALTYRFSRHWLLGLGGRYEQKRFRLADRGFAPDGVGEDRSVPVYGSLSYMLYPGTQISALLDMNLNGRLRVEDANGGVLYQAGYDESLSAGITFSVRL